MPGKQWVYHALQDPSDSASPADLTAMDAQIAGLRDETATINASLKSLRSTLSSLESTMSTADLRAAVAAMENEKEEVRKRLDSLRSGDVKPVRKEEKEAVDRELAKWERIASKRARIVRDMWGSVLDALPEGAEIAELRVSVLDVVIGWARLTGL